MNTVGARSPRATPPGQEPPWVHADAAHRRRYGGAGLYMTLPGGRDEPPGSMCTACGRVDGVHGPWCEVAAYEAAGYAAWVDGQLEANDPALWIDVIANADAPLSPPAHAPAD